MSLEEFSKKLSENNKDFLPGLIIMEEKYERQFFRDVMGPEPFPGAFTSERVMPAAVKGSDVEQQAEEVRTQVQQENSRESKDR